MKLFEVIEKRLRDATCPEDFFGEINPKDMNEYEKVRAEEFRYFEKSIQDPQDANEKHRGDLATSALYRFDSWARQKIVDGVYGNRITYRLKVLFVLREKDGQLQFVLMRNPSLHQPKLMAGLFEDGYTHTDEVHILREGVPIKKGYTAEYGTHAAMICFHGIFEGWPRPYLEASDFLEYDIVEVNTWRYGSFDKFIKLFHQ